ncbi:MAG TPA: ABC transporter ATP-binding protein [Actinomycetota bacterium]|nr:ABC transporter ATP-binding protein [Actinomycetota bacterium]
MLEVRGLNVFYGEAPALVDVTLSVGDGEILSIVGSNGAGKSTLVNTVAGLLPARAGEIVINGSDLARLPPHRVCDHGVAIVPEGRRIFPAMTVQDNLDLGTYRRDARERRGERLAWIHTLFPILKERAGQQAGTLSGGEQQMLAIGRALMADPKLLLLDEPSLGLSPLLVDTIFEVIAEINRAGVSVCLVEQNVSRALELSNRGYLIQEGRIVLEGSPDELLDNEDVRRACLGV